MQTKTIKPEYKRPESELLLIEHTDFILYDLPPVDDEGEDDW